MLKGDGNVHWEDGDIWTREAQASGTSAFGFRLHSKVRLVRGCSGVPADELGIVVGFTPQCVEVKFLVKILRCLPADLRESVAPAKPSPSSTTAQVSSSTERGSSIDGARPRRATSQHGAVTVKSAQWTLRAHAGTAASQLVVENARRDTSAQPAAGKLRASDASVPARAGNAPRPAAGNTSVASDLPWHTGVVTWSSGSMAWLQCKALWARFPDHDIFLHRSEFRGDRMPRQWDRISFRLMTGGDGRPRAVQARPEDKAEAVSAEDWFAARRKLKL